MKIEKGNDLSFLKISNYYMVPLYMFLQYLLEKHINKVEAANFSIYFLIPLLLLQGLYESLDKESKKEKAEISGTGEQEMNDLIEENPTEDNKHDDAKESNDVKTSSNTKVTGNATVTGKISINLDVKV